MARIARDAAALLAARSSAVIGSGRPVSGSCGIGGNAGIGPCSSQRGAFSLSCFVSMRRVLSTENGLKIDDLFGAVDKLDLLRYKALRFGRTERDQWNESSCWPDSQESIG